jgi:nitroimidazol reductase NimA-like FMN-containing flavoprotein (pyridoxamine 5'-phosphate oxidase superfamily)
MGAENNVLPDLWREDLQELGPEEMEDVLTHQDTVHVGFAAGNERYLIPLGYVWLDGCLCGFTSLGRKTRLARRDSRVSFQLDTSATTGHFTWMSVTGQGNFELVEEPARIEQIGQRMSPQLVDTPAYLQRYVEGLLAAGKMVAWRIRPSSMTGVKTVQPDH